MSERTFWTLAGAGAAVLLLMIGYLGMRQFGAEDGGITAVLAYMMKLGYHPYSDFETTGFPPLFLLLGGFAFKVLGTRWEALVWLAAVLSAGSFVAQSWLLRRAGLDERVGLALALFTQAATFLPMSGWWYNQMTSVAGVLFLSAALALLVRPDQRTIRIAFVLTAVMLALSKPNLAAVLLVGAGLCLLISRETRVLGPVLLLISGGFTLLLLAAAGMDPRDVMGSYLEASQRVTAGNFRAFMWINDNQEARYTLAFLTPIVAIGGYLGLRSAISKPRIPGRQLAYGALAVVGIVAGFAAMGTNNDHNIVDAPVIVLSAFTLARMSAGRIKASAHKVLSWTLMIALVGLIAGGLSSAVTRARIESIGGGLFYEDTALSKTGGPEPMSNVYTGPNFKSVVSQVESLLTLNPRLAAPDAPVYFGPRLLVMYPEFGIHPPKGLPTWWGLYPDGAPRTSELVTRFRENRSEMLVFLNADYTFYPLELLNVLYGEYDVYSWGTLTIHVLRGSEVTLPNGAVQVRP